MAEHLVDMEQVVEPAQTIGLCAAVCGELMGIDLTRLRTTSTVNNGGTNISLVNACLAIRV